MKDYLTLDELAKKLRVTPQTVRRWCQLKKIPSIRIGNRFYVPEGFEEELLEEKITIEEVKL